ncbi:MAG: hypothetical protein P8K27_01325 [Gammaproteobacteria bacterium]|nr:hypothetical protein [Gammaproteobacteria bacterium]
MKSEIRKNSGTYFAADTDKVIREPNGNSHTVEPYWMSNEFLNCMSLFEGIGIDSLAIDTVNFTFTYVAQNYKVRVSPYLGTCIKRS